MTHGAEAVTASHGVGVVLRPFRAARPAADGPRLANMLCPPYDVIDPATREQLLEREDNAVAIVLPSGGADRYLRAAALLRERVDSGVYRVDRRAALYVYEMKQGAVVTRGLVGAVELRDPDDGVILAHENTMAGPVADRLALLDATRADVEPIYLVYDGGGPASHIVHSVSDLTPLARCRTDDAVQHTLWAITDAEMLSVIGADLVTRRAVIADGHHRYATYRALQQRLDAELGVGPWDFGLALLVDSAAYGPQVHAIHRFLPELAITDAIAAVIAAGARVEQAASPEAGLSRIVAEPGFAVVLSDGARTVTVIDGAGRLAAAAERPGDPAALAALDVTILHRGLVERVLGRRDHEQTVGYAHSVAEALAAARTSAGCAVLLRPTPLAAVAAIAAAGARMPRKSTLFTPKPASGLLLRRFIDGDQIAPA